MTETLPYASPTTPSLIRPRVGQIAAAIAISCALLVVIVSFHARYQLESYVSLGRGCGTPRLMLQDQLYFFPPLLCTIPFGALIAAQKAQFAIALCRGSLLAAVGGWIVCAFVG